jgi:hypothetical protein
LLSATLLAVAFEADRAAQVLVDQAWWWWCQSCRPRRPGAWAKVVVNGVPVVAARRLPSMLRSLPAVLSPERVAALGDQARIGFHPAA